MISINVNRYYIICLILLIVWYYYKVYREEILYVVKMYMIGKWKIMKI